jgi:predicted anti-sigma-YlaC factor YlaD
MKCSKVKQLIYLSLEEDLKQEEKEELLEHLKTCRTCNLEWEEAKNSHLLWKTALVQESLPQISEQELPERVKRKIEELKIAAMEKPKRGRVFSFLTTQKKLAYAGAVIILAFISLWLGIFSKSGKRIPKKEVVVHSAFIDDKKASISISESEDKNIVLIWLETS